MKTKLLPSLALAALVVAGCKPTDTTPPDGDTTPKGDTTDETPEEEARNYPDPPPPSEPRPVNFPDLQTFEMPNKLKVYVVENHEVPIVDVNLVINTGEVHDELLANMTASILSEGTKKRSKEKLDAAIEQVGAGLSVSAGTLDSSIGTRVLSKDVSLALDIINDVAQNPKMNPESVDKLKKAQKVGLRASKSSGTELAQRLLGKVLYPEGHPYGRPFATEADIDAVTVEKIKEFHDTWYRPNNAYLILSGDIDKAAAEKLVKKTLGRWEPRREDFPAHPLEAYDGNAYQAAVPENIEVHIVDRKSVSADIIVGNLALARNHPDWIKMSVMNRILGASASSRLFQDIRETKRLTYNVNSSMVPAKAIGPFVIVTQTKEVDQMLTALLGHLDDIKSKDPTDQEFEAARNALARSFPLQVETPSQIAGKVSTQLSYSLPEDYYRTYRDNVLAVEKGDIREVASKHLRTPVIVIVGRAKKIQRKLEDVDALKGAKIVVYDTDLKPKK